MASRIFSLYNFNEIDITNFAANLLRLYSLFFLASIFPKLLIFYYEAIERSVFSTFISVLYSLVLSLTLLFALYNIIGSKGIWMGFTIGDILMLIIIVISVKIIQKKEQKFSAYSSLKRI